MLLWKNGRRNKKKIVPPTGFEPARPNGQGILSPLCLN